MAVHAANGQCHLPYNPQEKPSELNPEHPMPVFQAVNPCTPLDLGEQWLFHTSMCVSMQPNARQSKNSAPHIHSPAANAWPCKAGREILDQAAMAIQLVSLTTGSSRSRAPAKHPGLLLARAAIRRSVVEIHLKEMSSGDERLD